jgi:hypothetical protein
MFKKFSLTPASRVIALIMSIGLSALWGCGQRGLDRECPTKNHLKYEIRDRNFNYEYLDHNRHIMLITAKKYINHRECLNELKRATLLTAQSKIDGFVYVIKTPEGMIFGYYRGPSIINSQGNITIRNCLFSAEVDCDLGSIYVSEWVDQYNLTTSDSTPSNRVLEKKIKIKGSKDIKELILNLFFK